MYQTSWLGIIRYSDSEYFDLCLGLSRILLLIGNNSVVWLDIVVQKKISNCWLLFLYSKDYNKDTNVRKPTKANFNSWKNQSFSLIKYKIKYSHTAINNVILWFFPYKNFFSFNLHISFILLLVRDVIIIFTSVISILSYISISNNMIIYFFLISIPSTPYLSCSSLE